ncbi:nascent polypeptide-associated complex subunit alpha, muscle-specific form-like [Hetaerina americana]|uniref:nascent polypeptide-associated complex subunit alpha, muscle-specific form-like n=1 Tax=Hetaerina americana TaxID=62018 RepID=UPI003A7F54F0
MGVLVVETEANDAWIPPPPKKKWIRHYLSGEIPKDYTSFSSSAPSELSPLPSGPPSPPSASPRPPPPPANGLLHPSSSYSPPSSSSSAASPPPSQAPPPPPRSPAPASPPARTPLHHHAPASTPSPILHNHLHRPPPSSDSPPAVKGLVALHQPNNTGTNNHLLLHHQHQGPPTPPPSGSAAAASFQDFLQHRPPGAVIRASPPPPPAPPVVAFLPLKTSPLDAEDVEASAGDDSPSRAFRRITVSSQLARLEEAQELRRRVGSGTREVHNKLEKNRRAHLKECFELLKKQLPASQEEKKSSNLSILHSALRNIQSLKRKERDHEHEMERLAREKIASQQRLSALKKELSAQWDHIDFNALLPQEPSGGTPPGGPRDSPPPLPHEGGPDDDEGEEDAEEGGGIGRRRGLSGGTLDVSGRKDSYGAPPGGLHQPIHIASSDHYSNSTSTASERGHLSDEGEDMFVPSSRGTATLLMRPSSLPPRSPRPSPSQRAGGSSGPPSPALRHHQSRGSVLHKHRPHPSGATTPPSPSCSPAPRQLTPAEVMAQRASADEVVTTAPGHARGPGQAARAPPSIATALVSPNAPIHLLATPSNHQRHHHIGGTVHQVMAHSASAVHHPHQLPHQSPTSPKAPSPSHHRSTNCSPPGASLSPSLGSPQPLALTVHAPTTTLAPSAPLHHKYHHSSSSRGLSLAHKNLHEDAKPSLVSPASVAATISVPTIHLAGKVVQQPVAFLSPVTSAAPRSPQEVSQDMEGTIMAPSPGKFASSSPQHTLHALTTQQPAAVAIAGGSITLPNGVVAHAMPSPGAGVALARALSPGNAAGSQAHCPPSLPTTLTLAHSPTSGITHLVTPLAGHAALVTTSGCGATGHPLMAPLALVSSTGGPVAAHILGAGSSASVGAAATVGAKFPGNICHPLQVMSSGAAGAIPLLKPVAVGGQLPLMNAQYLTTAAALGGLAHLVKPLVVVSSAPTSAPNHHHHHHHSAVGGKPPKSGRTTNSSPQQ